MTNINLLPSEFKLKEPVTKVVKIFKKLNTILAIVLVISALAVASSYFIISNQLTGFKKQNDKLLQSVKALETTEQKTVLIQDRLEKLSKIEKSDYAQEEFLAFDEFLKTKSGDIHISETVLDETGVTLGLRMQDSRVLAEFIDYVESMSYSNFQVSSLTFDPEKTFNLGIRFVKGI